MDPSYTNGVGTNAFGTGAPIISSGEGVVFSSAPEKKSHKGVVILIILIVMAALAGGGYLIWQNFGGGNAKNTATVNNVKDAYNSFANYVLYGEESTAEIDTDEIEDTEPYFSKITGDELEKYQEKAEEKYTQLAEKVDEAEVELSGNIEVLESLFVKMPGLKILSDEEILAGYLADGAAATREVIQERYSDDDAEWYYAEYLGALSDYAERTLELLESANGAGCIADGEVISGCFNLSEDDVSAFGQILENVIETKQKLYWRGMDVLKTTGEDIMEKDAEAEDAE